LKPDCADIQHIPAYKLQIKSCYCFTRVRRLCSCKIITRFAKPVVNYIFHCYIAITFTLNSIRPLQILVFLEAMLFSSNLLRDNLTALRLAKNMT